MARNSKKLKMKPNNKPQGLYWDNHSARYYLLLQGDEGRKIVVSYLYFQMEMVGQSRVLRFDEDCDVAELDEEHSLNRQCCIDYMGVVGQDLELRVQDPNLSYTERVVVEVPKELQRHLPEKVPSKD